MFFHRGFSSWIYLANVCLGIGVLLNFFFVFCFWVWLKFWFLLIFLNRVLEGLMMKTIGGHHGWSHCSKRVFLFNASYMLILTRVNVTCIAWTVRMVLSVLSVSHTTRITVPFRFAFEFVTSFMSTKVLHKNFASDTFFLFRSYSHCLSKSPLFLLWDCLDSFPFFLWILVKT